MQTESLIKSAVRSAQHYYPAVPIFVFGSNWPVIGYPDIRHITISKRQEICEHANKINARADVTHVGDILQAKD